MKSRIKIAIVIAIFVLALFGGNVLFLNNYSFADVQDDITEKEQQIKELEELIQKYQGELETNSQKKRTLESEIYKLNTQINQIQAEIKSLDIYIDKTEIGITDTQDQINDAKNKIETHKNAMGGYLQEIYFTDKETLTHVLLKNGRISEFFDDLNNIQTTQDNLRLIIENIRQLKLSLEEKEEGLRNKKDELEQLRYFQSLERNNVASIRNERSDILNQTKGQEKQFQDLISKSKRDIAAIQSQITYLVQQGITAEDAVKFGELAARRVGIRPAFLIAILEIESGLGRNVGSGNWRDDMYECYIRLGTIYYPSRKSYYLQRAETEKNAFFEVVNKLGLDPDSVKVSAEPNYGCGGAMGPAQFIPSTWLAYEDKVAELTGHNPPNPWNIEDAFMASAIKLAAGGATSQTRAGESGAARAYIGGKTTCSSSICNYYANAVLRKADEIEKNL
ncbi:MAG: hypothetical protein COV29_02910 [Candidatus Yanofskybacteria bacterium CG10_big_fil_rev_8_21_14_0_10_36_16]|uniref:Transglycosylase SLT domain-containing protein n=1 Tax=Candidatus Yanofskybacteria bacterium CG10_big_fil_rev_8_21_14_0_10_36_16 TaxID=1975096 RepID=A0A2J0Q6T4_9BACT|nr:MAG: hypothetical protein COV29_02910 [Candidatus Yanofskybacteria bacterium CG10_big_fil_rev_8_21_14_0_10_36_16]